MEENWIIYLQVKEYIRWKAKEWDGGRQIVKDKPSGSRTLWYLYGNKVFFFFFFKKWVFTICKVTGGKTKQGWFTSGATTHEPGVCVRASGALHLLLKMFSVAQTGSRLMGWELMKSSGSRSLMPHLSHYLLSIFQLSRACFSGFLGGIQKCLGRRAQTPPVLLKKKKQKQKNPKTTHVICGILAKW